MRSATECQVGGKTSCRRRAEMQTFNCRYPYIPKPVFCNVHNPVGTEREAVLLIVAVIQHPSTLRLEFECPFSFRSHPEIVVVVPGDALETERIEPAAKWVDEVLP